MKKNIHPKLYKNAKVTDLSSGKSFVIASTQEEIEVEVTNLTHPYYTGKQRIVDTENLVKKFEEKRKQSDKTKVAEKKNKRRERRTKTTTVGSDKKLTLKDMLKQMQ